MDTILSLGLMICFYYGLTAFAAAWYARHELRSVEAVLLEGVVPARGGLTSSAIFARLAVETIDPEYGSGGSVFGVGTVFVLGVGVLLGLVVMFAWQARAGASSAARRSGTTRRRSSSPRSDPRGRLRHPGPELACPPVPAIGVMREGPLHAAVKALLAEPGDRLEVPVGRFVIDLVRADGELVEVQTGSFGALGAKLDALLDEHRIRIVHPIAAERRIVRADEHGEVLSARRSPKRATAVAVFGELVAFPSLLTHPNLTIEVLLLREDHVRGVRPAVVRGRRRDPGERRLVDVLERILLRTPQDVLAALPALPPEPFSTRELAARLGCSPMLARRTLYCLRSIGIVEPAGKRGRAPLHALRAATSPAAGSHVG